MTPLPVQQLAEYGKRAAERGAALTEWLNRNSPFPGLDAVQDAEAVLEVDVPALLAEVERLRSENRGHVQHIASLLTSLNREETRVAELETGAEKVAAFVAQRAEVITAIRNCHPDNSADYNRWQGHAEARRVLAEQLGLPIAWPAATEPGDPS